MSDRIERLRRSAEHIKEEKDSLDTRSAGLRRDQALVGELLREVSGEEELAALSGHKKTLDGESRQTEKERSANREARSGVLEDSGSYLEALEGNLSKLEAIRGAGDLRADTSAGEADTRRRIQELTAIRELLEGEDGASQEPVNQILDKPGVRPVDMPPPPAERTESGAYAFPLLHETRQTWHRDRDGSQVFNTPQETGRRLDSDQGKARSPLSGLRLAGTCGLVSCANVLRLGGAPATEQQLVDLAVEEGLCAPSGGTTARNRRAILKKLGMRSSLKRCTVDAIAEQVAEGRGVIISVYAARLWNLFGIDPNSTHAVVVTSVRRDARGKLEGFYICDSGEHGPDSACKYYTADQIDFALTGREMNVTPIIR